jgi:hypothetical protein
MNMILNGHSVIFILHVENDAFHFFMSAGKKFMVQSKLIC